MGSFVISTGSMKETAQYIKKKSNFDQGQAKGFLTSVNWMFRISAVLRKCEFTCYIFENREDCRNGLFLFR